MAVAKLADGRYMASYNGQKQYFKTQSEALKAYDKMKAASSSSSSTPKTTTSSSSSSSSSSSNNPTSTATVSTSPTGYYKIGDEYFFINSGKSFFKVSDPTQINLLNSGAITSTKASNPVLNGLKDTTTGTSTTPTTTTPTIPTTTPTDTTTPTNTTTPSTTSNGGTYDDSLLKNSTSFKNLSSDQQSAVLAVFNAIASNDTERAKQIAEAFKVATEISNPFFKQELRLAVDAIERGYVAIDQEEEYKKKQIQNNLADLQQDLLTKKDYLSFEEQSALKGIERQYNQDLQTVRQSLAATGKTFSSEKDRTEGILAESTGDLRETTTRRFGIQNLELERQGQRSQRDTQAELDRLAEVTKANRVDFLRTGEAKVGTKNLPNLGTNISPLGNIVGDIPQRETSDIITGAQNLIF